MLLLGFEALRQLCMRHLFSSMRRNIPKLLSLYLKVVPQPLIRTKHNNSFTEGSQSSNQISRVKTRHLTPSSVYHLPILDSVVPSPSVPKPPPDALAECIKSTSSLKQLFEIVSTEKEQLEEHHLTLIFRSILQFQSTTKTCYTPDAIKNHVGFVKLCNQLCKVAPHMTDAADLVVCLKTLVFCQVDSDSRIIQMILHIIKSRVNDLGLQQIIFLHFLLKRLKSPLSDALIIALPVVFQSQLETQLEVDKVKHMCDCLRYSIEHRMPAPKIKFIVNTLLSYPMTWETNQLCSVIWSLGKVRYLSENGISPLLEDSLNRLAKQVDLCERQDLERTLVTLGENYTRKSQYWYNEELCKATIERVIREHWPLASVSVIGRTFSKMSYVNFDFLDYYSELIANSSDNLAMHPHYFLAPFAVANYKPSNFEEMMDVLMTSQRVENNKDHLWYRFAVDCASLGFYPSSLISHIFQESYINRHFGKVTSDLDWLQLDTLHRSVRIECPEYSGPYPSPEIIEQCHRKVFTLALQRMSHSSTVEKALQTALGGLQYIASGLLTKSGHFIDHVLALRPGGYPVAINITTYDSESIRYVEDLKIANDSQLVFIKVLNWNAYIVNGERLRGVSDLEIRTLERTGFDVVSLNLEKWESLLDFEKIPFLMQQIRLKEKLSSS